MRQLNGSFRGKIKRPSSPHFPQNRRISAEENYLGDIVISLEQAERQAEENKLGFEAEIKQLILHGILHLCGYDHETDAGEMNERELELRAKLDI
jgi:probable rRNA maturation factor